MLKDVDSVQAFALKTKTPLPLTSAVAVRWYLEFHALKTHTIIIADCPFMIFTQDIVQIPANPSRKGRAFLCWLLCKFQVEGGHIDISQCLSQNKLNPMSRM